MSDVATVRQLRGDVALQISRCLARRKLSEAIATKRLRISRSTLLKVVNGRVSGLSLDFLIRIAVRAGLDLVLQTGAAPEEAGAFISTTMRSLRPRIRSTLADDAKDALLSTVCDMTPEQRLDAFLEHNEMLASLHRAGKRQG